MTFRTFNKTIKMQKLAFLTQAQSLTKAIYYTVHFLDQQVIKMQTNFLGHVATFASSKW